MSSFANNFRIIRNALKISQAEIGEAIGRSKQAVTKWEQGLSEPTATDLMNIADFLNVPIDLLIRESTTITQFTYKTEAIFLINSKIENIKKELEEINNEINNPQNKNIINFEDTGKQRVPKIQFRQNNQQSNINIQSNGEIKIEKSFNSNNSKK